MTIHSEHPFATPAGQRAPLRRLRGQLPAAVSVWATAADGAQPGATSPSRPGEWAALTVSSFLVVEGEPGALLALVDAESEFAELMSRTGRVAVSLLAWTHRDVADVHAGLAPSPGGPFRTGRWQEPVWGPVLTDATAWAAGSVVAAATRDVGWSKLIEVAIEHVHLAAASPAEDDSAGREPLMHHRGRYLRGGM